MCQSLIQDSGESLKSRELCVRGKLSKRSNLEHLTAQGNLLSKIAPSPALSSVLLAALKAEISEACMVSVKKQHNKLKQNL